MRIRVLIVDDEVLVRVGLKSYIDWEKNGYELLEDARDGMEAMERIKSLKPDIVLTDIKMPKMDGLALIKKIREMYPEIYIIVLSCYDDFEVVREAMKLGADDYIRKLSIKFDELLAVLNEAKSKIMENSQNTAASGETEEEPLLSAFQKNSFYRNLIADDAADEQGSIPIPGISFDGGRTLCLSLDSWHQAISKYKNKESLSSTIGGISENILKTFGVKADVFQMDDNEFGINLAERELDRKLIQTIQNQFNTNMNLSVSIGIGPLYEGITQFIRSYKLSREIRQIKFYGGKGCVREINRETCFIRDFNPNNKEFGRLLKDALMLRKTKEASAIIGNVFKELMDAGNIHPETVRGITLDMLSVFSGAAAAYHGNINEIVFNRNTLHHKYLIEIEFFEELALWFQEFLAPFMEYMESKSRYVYSDIVLKALDYIIQNKNREITLNEIAGEIKVSESYLSILFKKELGKNFVSYINEIKISLAKEYLEMGDLVYEAADKVGFENSNYFSKVFKKYTGFTPEEYRSKFRRQQESCYE